MFEAIIEIPKGSNYKYEIQDNILGLDRVLNQFVPFNYGFIPRTLFDDGDGLDVFVLSHSPIYPTTSTFFVPIGIFNCLDNGEADDKVVGILCGEESSFPEKYIEECKTQIKNYLETYKPGFHVLDFKGKNEAIAIIWDAQETFKEREGEVTPDD